MKWIFLIVFFTVQAGIIPDCYGEQSKVQFKIDSAADSKLYQCLNKTISKFCTTQKECKCGEVEVLGNFLQKSCESGPKSNLEYDSEIKDASWFELSALHYELPNAFGVVLRAGDYYAKNKWYLSAYYSQNGKTIVGEGVDLNFTNVSDRSKVVYVGDSYEYKVGTLTVSESLNGTPYEIAKLYLSSPEKMRDLFVEKNKKLLQKIVKALKRHEAKKIEHGEPFKNESIPPPEIYVAMTPTEEKVEIEKAKKIINERISLMQSNYKTFYDLVTKLPLKECF